jgi:ATP-dependent RNA helicase DeaD
MANKRQISAIERLFGAASPGERVPEVVDGLSAPIERGHNLAIVAGEGARLCRLYAACCLRDLTEAGADSRALVVAATPERANRLARSIHRVLSGTGLEVIAWGARSSEGSEEAASAPIVVGTAARLLADMRGGALSLGELALLALDDVRGLQPEWPAVEAILQAAAENTRRIAVTHGRDEKFDDLVERRLPRARRWPQELFEEHDADRDFVAIGVGASETHDSRLERLVGLVHDWTGGGELERVEVWCDSEPIAASVRSALAIEGFEVDAGGSGISVQTFDHDEPDRPEGASVDASVAFGLPWTPAELGRLAPARRRIALVSPRHVRQMEILAERLGWRVKPVAHPAAEDGDLARFRALVADAIESRDLAGDALLIEPLVEEHGYHRVAAALAGLCRELDRSVPARAPDGGEAKAPGPVSRDSERATAPTWTKIFVNVGKQDGATPGDFVGAITGETRAAGAQIGKIEIKPRFALIDVDSQVADDIVRGLNGKRLKGRDVLVRLDRGR